MRMAMRFDTIWHDARLATLAPGRSGLGIVERGAVAAKDGRIVFAGPAAELPAGCGRGSSASPSTAAGSRRG